MPDLQKLLGNIQRLDSEATPGPWYGVMDDLTDVVQIFHDQEQRLHVADIGDKTLERVWQDAEFIALARTALPQLAKAVRDVTKECDRLKKVANNTARRTHNVSRSIAITQAADSVLEVLTDAIGVDDAA